MFRRNSISEAEVVAEKQKRGARRNGAPSESSAKHGVPGEALAKDGGEGGIRTHGRVPPTLAFEASSFNRSDTSPRSRVFQLNKAAKESQREPIAKPIGISGGRPTVGLASTPVRWSLEGRRPMTPEDRIACPLRPEWSSGEQDHQDRLCRRWDFFRRDAIDIARCQM